MARFEAVALEPIKQIKLLLASLKVILNFNLNLERFNFDKTLFAHRPDMKDCPCDSKTVQKAILIHDAIIYDYQKIIKLHGRFAPRSETRLKVNKNCAADNMLTTIHVKII